MENIDIDIKDVMETALQAMIIAMFVQTLPEALRKELEDKGYQITLSDGVMSLYVRRWACSLVERYVDVTDEDENYCRFYDEDRNFIKSEGEKFLSDLRLVNRKPDSDGMEIEREPDSDMNEIDVWLEGYVYYNIHISIENLSPDEAIKAAVEAAKQFSGVD